MGSEREETKGGGGIRDEAGWYNGGRRGIEG